MNVLTSHKERYEEAGRRTYYFGTKDERLGEGGRKKKEEEVVVLRE